MTSFPIFKRLNTVGYGLYPGTKRSPDLDIAFNSGLTLVLGANGLGKTTLVTLLYRMCTGPYDLPAMTSGGELGGKRRQARKLPTRRRRVFAERVNDGAASATATLEFTLDEARISLTRALDSLELVDLQLDGQGVRLDEDEYQRIVLDAAGVSTFGDWILLLRHLTFYFEDRRALVWDPSAQRQLLRLLFLSPTTSKEWTDIEREVLTRDSAMRNFRYVVSTEESSLTDSEEAVSSGGDIRGELAALEDLQKIDRPKLEQLNDRVTELDATRQAALRDALKAESEHESAFRDLERRQLTAIASAFPSSSDTARYLMAQLISDQECLACGADSPKATAALKKRIGEHRCVVCNSKVTRTNTRAAAPKAIAKALKALDRAAAHRAAAAANRERSEAEFEALVVQIQELNARISERSDHIETLARRLPPDEAELHEQRSEVAQMRGRLETMKLELDKHRKKFARLIKRTSLEIVAHKEAVQHSFAKFAEGFLLEDCNLAWAPHKDQIGETGPSINFPAYELEMGGADFDSPVRREGPEQVSESQREFIDLAFRMALICVAGNGGVGSIVIDAPESSLDAVFVERAAKVLVQYAKESDNRLIVTSNLIEGSLIPELMRRGGIRKSSSKRIVDLLEVASPTAATAELHDDYVEVREDLFRRANKPSR